MSRDLEGAVLLVLGTVLARITLEGSYLAYVKSNLFWPLLVTSTVLLFLGVATLRRQPGIEVEAVAHIVEPNDSEAEAEAASAASDGADGGTPGHAHHGPPRMGVLLLTPVLVLVLMAPPPLGAFAADRGTVNSIAEDFAADLPPLDQRGDEPVELSISEFVLRTLADGEASVEGIPVRLTGFVAHDDDEDGFRISRFAIACCAADASPRQVRAVGATPPAGDDEWVEAVVVWHGSAAGGDEQRVPAVTVLEVRGIDAPSQPYEYAVY